MKTLSLLPMDFLKYLTLLFQILYEELDFYYACLPFSFFLLQPALLWPYLDIFLLHQMHLFQLFLKDRNQILLFFYG